MEKSNIFGNGQNTGFCYELKLPKERVAVLIGKKGSVKKEIEDETSTKIDIDSKEGDVVVSGKDALKLFSAREIIRAISRGINPGVAMQLLKQDFSLEIIPLMDYIKNKNHLPRIRGRLIGRDGKSRQTIERLTDTAICIYGKTVAIVGRVENVQIAHKALIQLIGGSRHATVFRWLERKRAELKRQYFEAKHYGTTDIS